jgi:preprotein translocase subunit SecF
MLDIIGRKNLYFIISLVLIIPGVISLFLYGLNLSIDFTGGSRMSLVYEKVPDQATLDTVRKEITEENIKVATIQRSQSTVIVRTSPINDTQNRKITTELQKSTGNFKQEEFETVGPVIGQETALNALKSIVLASALIVLYLAWSFRKVPKPASSWRFGITAIITLIHDVLVLLGLFSLFGHFFHVEVDSLFLTALLTVMGFSVHDTIVVFDRIRENLLRGGSSHFAQTVNDAILQTMTRSLNTSWTALLVLLAMLLFGGQSTFWFVMALFIGIAVGTYSSIFNAAPLLVLWHELDAKRKTK